MFGDSENQNDKEAVGEAEVSSVEQPTEVVEPVEPAPEKSQGEVEDEESSQKKLLQELPPERASLPWYAIHTYSSYESRVKLSLEERIRSVDLVSKFGNIIVPQETIEELVRGKKKTSLRKLFPGYVMVQMCLDDETWHLVNATPKVTGFVGDARNPLPLSDTEVSDMLAQLEGGATRPRPRIQFEEGDAIKVIDGPFSDFNGTVAEVKPDKGKLRVLISIFGRNTPVELDFVQVEKV